MTPRIWRRFQITAEASFQDLHHALQAVCGWYDEHLFAFRTPQGETIAEVPGPDGPFGPSGPDAASVPIGSYVAMADRCEYEYDFGDGWLHELQVVDRVGGPFEHRLRLVNGARAFPPEDSGGLPGYYACVDAVAGGDDPDDRRDWLGDWDPEAFDRDTLARRVDH